MKAILCFVFAIMSCWLLAVSRSRNGCEEFLSPRIFLECPVLLPRLLSSR